MSIYKSTLSEAPGYSYFPKTGVTVSPERLPLYRSFLDAYSSCSLCPLHKTASTHVLFSGHIPCDVLFVGEAPGECEDIIGKPFVGPAGKKLHSLISATRHRLFENEQSDQFLCGFTNIISCAPWNQAHHTPAGSSHSSKVRQPKPEEIKSCSLRLERVVCLCLPKAIVLLGRIAENNFPTLDHLSILSLPHPAYILRQSKLAQQETEDLFINRLCILVHRL